MMKSIPSVLAILITFSAAIIPITASAELIRPIVKDFRPNWLTGSNRSRNELLKKLYENKRINNSPGLSSFEALHSNHKFKGLYYFHCFYKQNSSHFI